MVIGIIRIHTLFARILIDPGSTHSFVSISFVGLLGMLVTSVNFDLIVATPMRDSVVASRMLRDWTVMIGYKEMSVDLVLLNLHDFRNGLVSFLPFIYWLFWEKDDVEHS